MGSTAQTVVKLSAVDDVLGVLPYRIGFTPTESLVVMCLAGPRRRDTLVARVDLVPAEHDEAAIAQLLAAAARAEASAAVVVCYTDASDAGDDLPRRPLVDGFVEQLRERDIEVVDAVLVRSGRRWSYHCHDEACCPSAGTPLPAELTAAAGRYVAEAVHSGRAPLPDRAALAASVRPPDNVIARTARRQAADRAVEAIRLAATDGPEAVRRRTLALLEEVLTRWTTDTLVLSPLDAALLILGFRDVHARDEGVTHALDHGFEAFLSLFVELSRHADDPDAAPVCSMLAWAAHASGDGALAAVAVERALACEPDYSLARLINAALAGMIPPAEVRQLIEQVRADLRPQPR